MRSDLLNLPADAPAPQAWALLWSLSVDVPHPTTPGQTAGELLESLHPSLQRKIYHRITGTEPQEGTANE